MTDPRGKLILITGASRGIGAATARAMARKGARVLLLARTADALEQVAAAIRAEGGDARPYVVDVNDHHAVFAAAERIRAEVGVPDVLVNNAGGGAWLNIEDTSPEQAIEMVYAPYLAAFFVTRAFIPEMLARGSGHIVNVCSIGSRILVPGAPVAYTAARAALHGFTTALRGNLYGTGIRVTLYTSATVTSSYWAHNPASLAQLGGTTDSPVTLTPEQAADAIVRGVERNAHTVVVPFLTRVLYWLHHLAPDFFDGLTMRARPPTR